MKISQIKLSDINNDNELNEFVEGLLSKEIFNDHLFEQVFISVTVKLDSVIDLAYRRLWEDVYIKINYDSSTTSFDAVNNVTDVFITLSEAINFIYSVTPPRMKYLIPDSIKSINDIIESMKVYLMDTTSIELPHYVSIFREVMHLKPFETNWNFNTNKISFLRNGNNKGLIGLIIHSGYSLNTMLQTTDGTTTPIQIMFHCINEDDLKCLFGKFIIDHPMCVLNIKQDDSGIYVMAVSRHMAMTNDVSEFLRKSYRNLWIQ
jgi:hypothetical protein